MKDSFEFGTGGQLSSQNRGQELDRHLRQPFRPAGLLDLKSMHFHRELGGALHARDIDKLPSFQLCSVAKIGVLREGIVLPSSGVLDHALTQDSSGAVEVEE